jgi:hypothetical protein
MKTLKFLGSTVLLCLFVVACAKSNKEDQARIAGDNKGTVESDGTTDSRASDKPEVKFDITKEGAYKGTQVILKKDTEKAPKNAGEITISGDDAKRLYERMKIVAEVPNVGTESNGVQKTKQGKDLACSELTPRTGTEVKYSCNIHFDYRTGKLLYPTQVIKEATEDKDLKGTANTAAYTGKGLSILEGADGSGILSVADTDAKVLFDTLSVEEKSLTADGWLSSKEKMGANLRCYRHTGLKTDSAPSYTCSLSIGVNDGTVKSSDVTAPAAAATTPEEPAKDETTKTPDENPAPAAPADGAAVGV